MKKSTKVIILVLIIAILLLGIGYAAIQNITLNITGTASADPTQENFEIIFSGEPSISDEECASVSITDNINSTIHITGLTKKGQFVTVEYVVQNSSNDLSADLAVSVTNSNTEYFLLTSYVDKESLVAGEATKLIVKVELLKTPMSESVTSIIGVQLKSAPVEPGKEGLSGTVNDFSQSALTLNYVSASNIGDYINLGNNIIGNDTTNDDWRIFYRDADYVYAILADYLPVELIPTESNLKTNPNNSPYAVWSDKGAEHLLDGLNNTDAWKNFSNGIADAIVTGTPTLELLIDSYNIKNRATFDYTYFPTLNEDTDDYELYIPHPGEENLNSYWLATESDKYSEYTDKVCYACSSGIIDYLGSPEAEFAVRPVVALPLETTCNYKNNEWTILRENIKITNNNIGDYICFGNKLIETPTANDEWRILYTEEGKIYAILSDYLLAENLPISTKIKSISSEHLYSVGTESSDDLIDELNNTILWNDFTYGINGATATGSPSMNLILNSYNAKNNTEFYYAWPNYPKFDSLTKDYDLYVPEVQGLDKCIGYWLATYCEFDPNYLCVMLNSGETADDNYNSDVYSIRPVITLPDDISYRYEDGVWVVNN